MHDGRAQKLLETDFFARAKLSQAARRWNLASLATALLFITSRLTLKKSPAGAEVYGEPARSTLHCTWPGSCGQRLVSRSRPALTSAITGGVHAGNLTDGVDAALEINKIMTWLMDAAACPTDWSVLIRIRNENASYDPVSPQPTVV